MKRLASRLSLMLAALAVMPAALAGSEILKCVDSSGHVTLTDRPCADGAQVTRLAASTTPEADAQEVSSPASGTAVQPQPASVQRYAPPQAMQRYQEWRPRVANRARPLAADVATLKAARANLLLSDGYRQPQTRLAFK